MGPALAQGETETFEAASDKEVADAVQRVAQAFDGRLLAPATEERRYLDTFDWRIHRAGGWLCATREGDRVVVRGVAQGRALPTGRATDIPAFAEDLPAGPLRAGFGPIVAPRRLSCVADVRRTARTLELLDAGGKVFARVTAVTNELPSSSGPTSTNALLLQGVPGCEDRLQAVQRLLQHQPGLRPLAGYELDPILACLGGDAGRDPSALDVELSAEMTAGAAVSRVLTRLCEVLVVNRQGVMENLDTEFLHDFRVAVRRTRAVLGQVKHVLPAAAVEHYAAEFEWLGRLTGPARDLDVLLLNLPTYRRLLGEEDTGALDALARLVVADREREQTRLLAALEGPRFEQLLREWRARLDESGSARGAAAPSRAGLPVREVASRCTWKRYRKVRRIGLAIDQETPANELHAVRIQCKKLRYLLEVFSSLYPVKPVAAGIKALKRLQNTLGDFNDAQVHADMLRGYAVRFGEGEGSQSDATAALERLVSELTACRERERERFFGRFEAFAGDENHARFRDLFKNAR